MMIPNGPNGFPTVSPTMLRRYGSAGFRLEDAEETQGCPRLFRKQYVERVVPKPHAYELLYGSLVHQVFERLEVHDETPEEALNTAFADFPMLPPEAYQEAKDDLDRYFERGASPTDRYGMIGTERRLTGLLYVDEDHGPIYIQGILDWLGIDLEDPGVLHVVDYKTNRGRSTADEIRRDVQVRIYDLLAWLCWDEIVGDSRPQIVVHIDEIKFANGDIPVRYSDQERETFHAWLIAVVRHILRDEEGNPRLNPGCARCPVKQSCPKYAELPTVAENLLALRPTVTVDGETVERPVTDDDVMEFRDSAWKMKSLLEKACKEIDAQMLDKARASGGSMVLAKYEYRPETEWSNVVDARALHSRLGDSFYDVVTVTKSALERLVKDWPPSDAQNILSLIDRVPTGSKITKAKRK